MFMKKICLIPMLLALTSSPMAFAENAPLGSQSCVEWKSNTPVDLEAIEKVRKKSLSEKAENGKSFTKDQLIVLLAKNLEGARDVLANSKNTLTKTKEGLVDLRDAKLNGVVLSNLNLDYVDLSGAELKGADLSGSSLRMASLKDAELDGANLNNSKIIFANAVKVSLINASMCEAVLHATDFEDAVVRGANMKGAKLDMAKNVPKSIYQNAQSILQFGMPVPPNHLE